MEETFRTLRRILEKHAGHMRVTADTKTVYSIDAGYSARWRKDVYFGGVRMGKAYVSYHLIPVYACPELLEPLSPSLRARMQGKSCFNFRTISSEQAAELAQLTKRGVERFTEVAQIDVPPAKAPRGRKKAAGRSR